MASINFLSENINIGKITSQDTKIEKMTVNPISYHTTVVINGKSHPFELKVTKMQDGGFNVIINDPHVHGTIEYPLSIEHSDLNSALKKVLTNWETILSRN